MFENSPLMQLRSRPFGRMAVCAMVLIALVVGARRHVEAVQRLHAQIFPFTLARDKTVALVISAKRSPDASLTGTKQNVPVHRVDLEARRIAQQTVRETLAAESHARDSLQAGHNAEALLSYRQATRIAHRGFWALHARGVQSRAIASVQVLPLEMDAALDYMAESLKHQPQIFEAKQAARTALADAAVPPASIDLTIDNNLKHHQYAAALRALNGLLFPAPGRVGFNPVFVDSGASIPLQQGIAAALQGRNADARRLYLESLKRSPSFHYPELFLGFIDAIQNKRATAHDHWVKVLFSPVPAEPTPIRYDWATVAALRLIAG